MQLVASVFDGIVVLEKKGVDFHLNLLLDGHENETANVECSTYCCGGEPVDEPLYTDRNGYSSAV